MHTFSGPRVDSRFFRISAGSMVGVMATIAVPLDGVPTDGIDVSEQQLAGRTTGGEPMSKVELDGTSGDCASNIAERLSLAVDGRDAVLRDRSRRSFLALEGVPMGFEVEDTNRFGASELHCSAAAIWGMLPSGISVGMSEKSFSSSSGVVEDTSLHAVAGVDGARHSFAGA